MIDLKNLISSATRAAESKPNYSIHPDHASLIYHHLQFSDNGVTWHFLLEQYGEPTIFTYKDAVETCANLQANQSYTQWRVVGIVEVWRKGAKK